MLEKILSIKYYVIAMLIGIIGYAWAMGTGTRVLGDDRQEEEQQASGNSRSFYHK